MDPQAVFVQPHVSEQTYAQAEERNVYVFDVPRSATKQVIKSAVEKQFKVEVTGVRVAVTKGKQKQSFQKRHQPIAGRRATVKKAYVTVKSGDKIPIYEEIS